MVEQGFGNPVLDTQRIFRTVLTALSEPGRVLSLDPACAPPEPLDPAAAAIALTFCDADTPLWLAPSLAGAANFFRFHVGAPIVAAPDALFLLARPNECPRLASLRAGTPDYPDHSATVILAVDRLDEDSGWHVSGPGVHGTRRFRPQLLEDAFLAELQDNHARFPQGVDVVFAARHRIAALPRSTRVEA